MTEYGKRKIKETRLICWDKKIDYNSTIYRIMPIDRFIQVLTEKKFPLFRPKNWDDPFENLLLKSDFWLKGNYIDFKSLRDSYFGVCWSLTKENDAMWRIYSPDYRGVKIKTSISKIFNPIYSDLSNNKKLDFLVGCVSYCEQDDIIKELESINDKDFLNPDHRLIPCSLLFKRKEFQHENEVRFLFSQKDYNQDIFNELRFNWVDAIEEIEFDPRIDEGIMKSYTKTLTEHFGLNKETIKKSELYNTLILSINL